MQRYEAQIRDATLSLRLIFIVNISKIQLFIACSHLEKSEDPSEDQSLFAREEVLYPTLLISLILNLLTGGFLFKLLLPPQSDFKGSRK